MNKLVEKEITFVHSRARGWGQGGLDKGNRKVQTSTKVSTAAATAAKSLESSVSLQSLQCLTLCDPIDGSPPGSSVPGILQARTLEWVAISFSNAAK